MENNTNQINQDSSSDKEKNSQVERNQTDSQDSTASASIQDLISETGNAADLKKRIENNQDNQKKTFVARSSDVDAQLYPNEAPIVTNERMPHGD